MEAEGRADAPLPPLRGRRGRLRWLAGLLRRCGERALDLVYPGFCRDCGAELEGTRVFCESCAAGVRAAEPSCARCGGPAVGAPLEGCGGCAGRVIHFDRVACAAEYLEPWRTAVLRFKYLGDAGLRAPLGEALARVVRERLALEGPEAVVPVPGHPWRSILRGRDPVEELARDLGGRAGLPVARVLARVRWIASQTSLDRGRRLRNPGGAYAVRSRFRPRRGRPSPVLPRRVLLVDDVFTTGATASECARALKQAGVERVLVAAAARSGD